MGSEQTRLGNISIHSLIRGRTLRRLPPSNNGNISIHSLIRGRTLKAIKAWRYALFQSTPSYEGELKKQEAKNDGRYFNPLPHTRENIVCFLSWSAPTRFQSTPSYEGERAAKAAWENLVTDFNPLPHTRENSRFPIVAAMSRKYFNPLPHTRENQASYRLGYRLRISIHSLIRGRTHGHWKESANLDISIHSLIRGRTVINIPTLKRIEISIHSLIRGRTPRKQWAANE